MVPIVFAVVDDPVGMGLVASLACPCCGGVLHKLGEDVTETLEMIPRQWKVIRSQ